MNLHPLPLPAATLCFWLRGDLPSMVLLGYKKRGFGQGKWTGFGGKVENGETVIQATQRELHEETGVAVDLADLQPRGQVIFRFPAKPAWDQHVYLFVVTNWQGEADESDEMLPRWFPIIALPFAQMWADARYWLPMLLGGEFVNLQIIFATDNATVKTVQSGWSGRVRGTGQQAAGVCFRDQCHARGSPRACLALTQATYTTKPLAGQCLAARVNKPAAISFHALRGMTQRTLCVPACWTQSVRPAFPRGAWEPESYPLVTHSALAMPPV